MAWQACRSAEGAVIGTLGVCTGQDACLVLLGLPAVQEGGQIEIGILLVLPFPLPVEAVILSLWGCLGLLLGLRGARTYRGRGGVAQSNAPNTCPVKSSASSR